MSLQNACRISPYRQVQRCQSGSNFALPLISTFGGMLLDMTPGLRLEPKKKLLAYR
jgi:hypothetical protein